MTICVPLPWKANETQDERRALIRTVVERAEVMPGKGAERVSVTLVPELAEAIRALDRAAEAVRDDLDQGLAQS